MFDFVNRFNSDWIIIYQWDTIRAKQTFDAQKSMEWWRWCDRFREFTTKIYNKEIRCNVPITDTPGIDVTNELKVFLYNAAKSKRIDDLLVRIWWEFFKQFDCHNLWWMILFYEKNRKEKNSDDTIFNMKQFIYWFRRFEDVHSKDWKLISGEFEHYYDWNPKWEEFGNLTYNHNWKNYNTPVYGVYIPHMVQEIFREEETLPSGKYLQAWQKDFLWNMWQINFLFHSRRAGKSLLLQLIQFLMVKCERPKKWFKKMKINYFCQSQETFDDLSEYMENFAESYWYPYVWRKSKSSLDYVTFENWKEKVLGTVQFKSALSIAKGLGWTPYAVIIDEASRQPEMVYQRALANARLNKALIFCLTTVNYEEERDWCYVEAMKAYFQAMSYEPMEDTVVKLWKKYKIDQLQNPDMAIKYQNKMEDMRREFLELRKYSCLFYTIDDIEYISEKEKQDAIAEDSHRWEKFILAEYFSVFADNKKVFDPYRLIEEKIPQTFDNIFFAYDQAEKWDNPALNIVWVKDFNMYCLDSIILSETLDIQIQQIKRLKEEWQYRVEWNQRIRLSVDVTSKQSDVSSIELRWLQVDCPIYWNNGNSPSYFDWRILKVTRNWLFQNAIECCDLMYIKFAPSLDRKLWLLDEMSHIVIKDGNYKTQKTTDKDDQVAALLMNLYYIYNILWLKKTLFEKDDILLNQATISDDEILEIMRRDRSASLPNNYSIINY